MHAAYCPLPVWQDDQYDQSNFAGKCTGRVATEFNTGNDYDTFDVTGFVWGLLRGPLRGQRQPDGGQLTVWVGMNMGAREMKNKRQSLKIPDNTFTRAY